MQTRSKFTATVLAWLLFLGVLPGVPSKPVGGGEATEFSIQLEATPDVRTPELLIQLLRQHAALESQIAFVASEEERLAVVDQIQVLEQRIDQVGGQLYCSRSRLFWYTDLELAKAEAHRTGRPILSLRMLGKLTEELSCANSRFFRTTLYANQDVSRRMRDSFVLHWESVRPVPTLTIDFGDGRKLVRTVTGNSIHYVLTPDGEVVDALPGLFGPAMFMRLLDQAGAAAHFAASLSSEARPTAIAEYHKRCVAEIDESWSNDLRLMGDMTEVHSLQFVGNLEPQLQDEFWSRLAVLHAEDAALDANSTQLIDSENPTATQASLRALTKSKAESPLVRLLGELQTSIAQDSVRNRYLLHRQIHTWFAAGQAPVELSQLNEKVYSELFLTPSSDPWLGLVPPNTYTGLKNNGLVSLDSESQVQ